MNWFRNWWRSHYVVAKRYEPVPEVRLFQFGVIDADIPENSAHFFIIRLPFFGYGYEMTDDRERWGQRALFYHGRKGFSIRWLFTPTCPCTECRIDNERV